jgi:hypothetical protein
VLQVLTSIIIMFDWLIGTEGHASVVSWQVSQSVAGAKAGDNSTATSFVLLGVGSARTEV